MLVSDTVMLIKDIYGILLKDSYASQRNGDKSTVMLDKHTVKLVRNTEIRAV